MSLPDWKKVIDTEFNNYKSGKQNKAGYLTNVINYFTGAGTGNYPVKGQKVNPTDLTPADLLKYELYDFDIRKMAFEVEIQNNMVSSNRIPRDWAGVRANIDRIKTDSKYARSPPFDNYSAEEKAIWNNCQIPIIGKGTTSSASNHPMYNKLCDIYNNPGSKKFRDQFKWDKYYGDFCINGIGPADAFLAGDWNKQCYQLSESQLKAFQLPTDDARRLQIAMNRQQFQITEPNLTNAGKQAPYKTNITNLFDNNKYPLSPTITEAEKTKYVTLTTKPSRSGEPLMTGGRTGGRTRMRKGRGTRKSKQKRTRRH